MFKKFLKYICVYYLLSGYILHNWRRKKKLGKFSTHTSSLQVPGVPSETQDSTEDAEDQSTRGHTELQVRPLDPSTPKPHDLTQHTSFSPKLIAAKFLNGFNETITSWEK